MKIIKRLIIGVFLGLAIYIPIRLYLKKYAAVIKTMQQTERVHLAALELLSKSVLEHSRLTRFQTNGDLILTSLTGNDVALSKVVTGRTVVYRISESFCSDCNKAQLPYVKILRDKLGPNKVIILSSFSSIKDLSVFVQANHIEVPAYNIADSSLSFLPMEKDMLPYFFDIDAAGDIKSIFLAKKEIPMLSEAYCKRIH